MKLFTAPKREMARERARETERPGLERERERVHVSDEDCVSIITKCMPPQLHSMICAAAADASQFLQAKFAGCLLSSRGKATFFLWMQHLWTVQLEKPKAAALLMHILKYVNKFRI